MDFLFSFEGKMLRGIEPLRTLLKFTPAIQPVSTRTPLSVLRKKQGGPRRPRPSTTKRRPSTHKRARSASRRTSHPRTATTDRWLHTNNGRCMLYRSLWIVAPCTDLAPLRPVSRSSQHWLYFPLSVLTGQHAECLRMSLLWDCLTRGV